MPASGTICPYDIFLGERGSLLPLTSIPQAVSDVDLGALVGHMGEVAPLPSLSLTSSEQHVPRLWRSDGREAVSYTHLRAHET